MKSNEVSLSCESHDLFIVPRSDKQASQVVTSEGVDVETGVVLVDEEGEALSEEEPVEAEREEVSVEIPSVSAVVEEEPAVVEGSGAAESQVSTGVGSQAANEEECGSRGSEFFVAEEGNELDAGKSVEDADEHGDVAVNEDANEEECGSRESEFFVAEEGNELDAGKLVEDADEQGDVGINEGSSLDDGNKGSTSNNSSNKSTAIFHPTVDHSADVINHEPGHTTTTTTFSINKERIKTTRNTSQDIAVYDCCN
ncbi:hypothetical protein V6N13_130098 [Hibiscus sabdariffa]